MPRVVVDTNVVISGLISPAGTPGRVVAAILDGRVVAVITPALAAEIVDVVERPRLAPRIDDDTVGALLELVWPGLPAVEIDVDIRDVQDRIVLAAALAGDAEAIVTGDRDLLADEGLVAWLAARGIAVLTPADLLDLLGSGPAPPTSGPAPPGR